MIRRAIAAASVCMLVGCFDPVHDDRVDELGPEVRGVEKGPLHRPGQPCTVCHGGEGPGSPTFDVAGTVFVDRENRTPLRGATVWLVDESGQRVGIRTNKAGNFWLGEGELSVDFPFWTSVEYGAEGVEMETRIFRARSCAECHADPPGEDSVGHIYLRAQP